ncbi:MAG: ABC transporter ATP-binding protein [Anaerolineae bacterium]|nr:ABC transporter ATP-binding protein [Anaerolineae bacterium]NUQ05669.1 ABC transporter ATP-binding protein [Anaerolineae bacterium]
MGEPLLRVEGLRTIFQTGKQVVTAVSGVSYSVDAGETVGIVGESGSGKSVSMLAVMRLVPSPAGRITEGKIWFRGRNLLELDSAEMRAVRGKDIAMIFQDPMTSLNPVLSIGRHLVEPLKLHLGLTPSQAKTRAVELLQMVGIPDAANRLNDYPHQFSGGMRQRVMIALGLSCNPKLLIADEPTTALDVTIQAQIIDLVKRLRREFGMSVIWITHDLGIVAGLVDRVIVMYASHVVETAGVDDLYENPRHPYTLGLLSAIPRLDTAERTRLMPIPGKPPDLSNPPKGCPFAPRCGFSTADCLSEKPTLREVAPGHFSMCHLELSKQAFINLREVRVNA